MAKTTSDSVVATKRKHSLVLVALLSLCISVKAEANFTLSVIRRSTNDFYRLNSIEQDMHCAPNNSYLVNERHCVFDEELLYGMAFYLESNLLIIVISDSIRM